jgi:alkanesulfonate monooxygenase SsuD/methylene tetrahydromethanopterin reductase-like flavin-dependent oxidoreductase (luciferase family)
VSERGFDADALLADEAAARQLLDRMVWGDVDEAAERIRELMALGLDGFVVNLVADADDTEAVARAGATLAKALA